MTPDENKLLKEAMLNKILELKTLKDNLKESTKPLGLDNAVGRISRMDYINNKAVDESRLLKAESDLKSLDRWISICDKDTFGKCSRCRSEININRLLLMPASSLCIKCARKGM